MRFLRRERRRRAAARVNRTLQPEDVHGDRRDVHRDFVPVRRVVRAVEPAPTRVEASRLGERRGRVRGVERRDARGLVEVEQRSRGVRRDVGGDRRVGRDARAVVGARPPAALARDAAAVRVPGAEREGRRPRDVSERQPAPGWVVGHVPHAVVIRAQQQKRSLRREVVREWDPARAVVRGPLPLAPALVGAQHDHALVPENAVERPVDVEESTLDDVLDVPAEVGHPRVQHVHAVQPVLQRAVQNRGVVHRNHAHVSVRGQEHDALLVETRAGPGDEPEPRRLGLVLLAVLAAKEEVLVVQVARVQEPQPLAGVGGGDKIAILDARDAVGVKQRAAGDVRDLVRVRERLVRGVHLVDGQLREARHGNVRAPRVVVLGGHEILQGGRRRHERRPGDLVRQKNVVVVRAQPVRRSVGVGVVPRGVHGGGAEHVRAVGHVRDVPQQERQPARVRVHLRAVVGQAVGGEAVVEERRRDG